MNKSVSVALLRVQVYNEEYRKELKENILHYLCTMIKADFKISVEELHYINDNLGYKFTMSELKKKVKAYSGMKEKYDHLSIIDELTQYLNDETGEDIISIYNMLTAIVKDIGLEFLASDYNVTTKESIIYSKFMETNTAAINKAVGSVLLSDYYDEEIDNEEEEASDNKEEEAIPLDELLAELNGLVGLDSVKAEINSLINLVKVRKLREERGFDNIPMSFHMIFLGNPGTGKTTVARLLAKIYRSLGLLSKGHLVEVDRSGLVAGYIGQTAIKTKEVLDSALGGILFIDEAYSLVNQAPGDYGNEAIDTLIKFMEDNRNDFVVIAAGYPEPMEGFILANPGLKSRFTKYIDFVDYTPEELVTIFNNIASKNKYIISDEANNKLKNMLLELTPDMMSDFGNARGVRTIFEESLVRQASRIVNIENIDDDSLITITEEDI